MSNDNLANGHRQRVREKYEKLRSFDSYAPYEVLELLLFYALPRKDTKSIAKNLIATFGSLEGVISADIDALKKQPGIGLSAAIFLHSLSQLPLYLSQQNAYKIKGSGDVGAYAVNLMKGKTTEEFYVVALNPKNEIINTKKVASGNFSSVSADIAEIVKFIAVTETDKIIFIHNHTNGSPVPSGDDYKVTYQIINILKSLGITVADHIITAGNSYYSMADSGRLNKEVRL